MGWILLPKSTINASNGIAQKNLSTTWLANYEIPLPPLSVQKEIVDKINQYQKVIDGSKLVIENYKSEININPNWEMVPLGSIAGFKNGINYTKDDKGNSIKIVGVGDFKNYLSPQIEQLEYVVIGEQLRDEILLQENDLIFVRSNGNKELVGRLCIPANVATSFRSKLFKVHSLISSYVLPRLSGCCFWNS